MIKERINELTEQINLINIEIDDLFCAIKSAIKKKDFEIKKQYSIEKKLLTAKLLGLRTEKGHLIINR